MTQTRGLPLPYGTIPKRTKRNTTSKKTAAPTPFFSLQPTTSLLSIFSRLFYSDDKAGPVGFMPCTTTTQTQTSPFDIIVPISSSPIDCHYHDDHDTSSSYSTSSSSSNSSLSSYMEQEENKRMDGLHTTTALSDILCDHYVQTNTTLFPSLSDNELINVPLETFRIFEAPPTEEQQYWLKSDREWTLVETCSKPSKRSQKKEKEKVQVAVYHHERDIRSNAAYLRMIVAEVNMMRSQKIVGPLRPRRVLPKRTDRFIQSPSPLQSDGVPLNL
ncbi:hypothetical protein BD560DRAFT_410183 [Blakeslea trispora]|nr:hypothetical protein BD560DRAFT_410183 [Blakeslea trispora]